MNNLGSLPMDFIASASIPTGSVFLLDRETALNEMYSEVHGGLKNDNELSLPVELDPKSDYGPSTTDGMSSQEFLNDLESISKPTETVTAATTVNESPAPMQVDAATESPAPMQVVIAPTVSLFADVRVDEFVRNIVESWRIRVSTEEDREVKKKQTRTKRSGKKERNSAGRKTETLRTANL